MTDEFSCPGFTKPTVNTSVRFVSHMRNNIMLTPIVPAGPSLQGIASL
jgi:hypothetical protein